MKDKKEPSIVDEVRAARAEVAKERYKNPKKFHDDTIALMRNLAMKKSTLKPMTIDFLKLALKKEKQHDGNAG